MSTSHEFSRRRTAVLALGALGVVYGDIGTSPLYAFREAMAGHGSHGGVIPSPENVIGVLSLIIWALLTLISGKYLSLVMRADNDGEGGLLALLALGFPGPVRAGKAMSNWSKAMVVLALAGTALLFGDGMITPAISVLSAVEGLKVATPGLEHAIVPITVVILIALFSIQHRGTGKVGAWFGPITMVWFITIGVLGIRGILMHPAVLAAFNPWNAIVFLAQNGKTSAMVLGSVFLVVTGGEALYADMGHFGRKPIRLAWYTLVLPCLLLNYLGQGALVLGDTTGKAIESPFYLLAPEWFSIPLVIIGSMAAVIASQALISGAFSIAMQGIQMGFMPRMSIQHTSEMEHGQIYIAPINRAIMVGSITLVVAFKDSSSLAAAYGIAVCLTMVITTFLLSQVAVRRWHWPMWRAVLVCGFFILLELAFLIAPISKVLHGGWVPLLIGAVLLFTMLTWKKGRVVLGTKFADMSLPLEDLVKSISVGGPVRVRGTAIYLASSGGSTPQALLHNLKHNQVLHEKTIILTLQAVRTPRVRTKERLTVTDMGAGIWRVFAHYGFMEQVDVPAVLRDCSRHGLKLDPAKTSYFLGRETIVPTSKNLPLWQAKYFALLSRSSQSAMEFFKLPPNRVIELGAQIEV